MQRESDNQSEEQQASQETPSVVQIDLTLNLKGIFVILQSDTAIFALIFSL